MYLLGFDIGSSSVKVSLLNGLSGKAVISAQSPKTEMKIDAPKQGWAEQHPELWWEHLKIALYEVLERSKVNKSQIRAIGISYQMHGLVCLDKKGEVLRPSIIWCDSRAVEIGHKAFQDIGNEACLSSCLNSPGNFTASKLRWVKENEPDIYDKIDKIMLPGDYIAYRLTGEAKTTISGLSEGILWDFKNNGIANLILQNYEIPTSFIPEITETFAPQGELRADVAQELGLPKTVVVAYRAGDQPNNAFSLNVLNPGEIAATAGTSGVVYGVSGEVKYDLQSRINTFAHVNYTNPEPKLGVLLCVNGTGILNSWAKHHIGGGKIDYPEMNELAAGIPIGSDGLKIYPFGNGAERMLGNKNPGAQLHNIDFNRHTAAHIYRAAQEGIVFAFQYGMEVMKTIGINSSVIRAGKANMFLSPLFGQMMADLSGSTIELYNTDGSIGAARGAGFGCGFYKDMEETFTGMECLSSIEPGSNQSLTMEAYQSWKEFLIKNIQL